MGLNEIEQFVRTCFNKHDRGHIIGCLMLLEYFFTGFVQVFFQYVRNFHVRLLLVWVYDVVFQEPVGQRLR